MNIMTSETANAKDLVRFGGLTNTTNGMALANKMKAIVIANGMNATLITNKMSAMVITNGMNAMDKYKKVATLAMAAGNNTLYQLILLKSSTTK